MQITNLHHKIKDISNKHIATNPSIFTYHLAQEMQLDRQELLSDLITLEKLGLIKFNDTAHVAFSLTEYGMAIELPS